MTTEIGFQVGEWWVEPSTCQISLNQALVKLEPKVMELLVFMADHPHEVLSRDELLDNVWPGMVVGDEALTNAVIKLRKGFADDARHPRIIETIPKKGYRLVADVSRDEAVVSSPPAPPRRAPGRGSAPAFERKVPLVLSAMALLLAIAWILVDFLSLPDDEFLTTNLALPDKPSIAVLPFVNTGNDPEYSYFSDGMTDDLITDLSNLSGLFVISRNSTFQFKGRAVDVREVASILGVRYVLEGQIRRSGNRVRVNAQLIDGENGGEIWAERYDSELKDVFDLQDRISGQIVSALALQLDERDQAQLAESARVNTAAYDELLKGLEQTRHFNRDSFALAESHFKKALQIDPGYARAHAALASIYWQAWQQKWHVNSGSRVGGWVRAKQELDASMVQPTPLAYSLLSSMQLYNRRYEQAIAEARKAIEFNPNSAIGYLALAEALAFDGQPVEAIDNARLALRRDPNFPAPYLGVEGRALFDLKRHDEAIAKLKRALASNPDERESMVVLLAAYGQTGRESEAGETLNRLNGMFRRDSLPEFTQDWPKNRWPYRNQTDRDRLIQGLRRAGVPEW